MANFMREAIVGFADKEIKYPDLDIEFEINFDESSEGNVGFIRLFNLSNSTIDKIEKGQPISLEAGYNGDVGGILPGVILDHKTVYEEVDKLTEITVGDGLDVWLNATINRTWSAGKDTMAIAQDIADLLPFTLGDFEIDDPVTYQNGKTFSTTCKNALEELAADAGIKLHVSRGEIYFRKPESGNREIVNLSANTGLIGTPTKGEKEDKTIWDARSFMNYRIWSDEILQIESKTINGLYRVTGGRHRLSGDDFETEMEVVRYDD